MRVKLFSYITICILIFFTACGGGSEDGSGDEENDTVISTVPWGWISGSDITNQKGIYGTKGVADSGNIPGARSGSVSWKDSLGNLWLFGGKGYDSAASLGFLNDLWKYDGTNWTWISGSNIINQAGVYGTKGTPDSGNIPGARSGSVSWIDSSGNFWIFGGEGNSGSLINDLWKYDGTNWTWISGDKFVNQYGVYGTKGTAASGNKPGARKGGSGWIDSSNNLWIFGGTGRASTNNGLLNDLWKFDGTNWTWVSGSDLIEEIGIYGTKGTADSANIPGARDGSISWRDSSNNLWLFGGHVMVNIVTREAGLYNDLWKYDVSAGKWTWISGSNTLHAAGNYGTQGVSSSSNIPGSRQQSIRWIDSSGNFWLFGGIGVDSSDYDGALNDLWKFDGSNWIWISGSRKRTQNGVFGTKSVSSTSNVPASRGGSIGWIDSSGDLWIFGGKWKNYVDSTEALFSDLWKCEI